MRSFFWVVVAFYLILYFYAVYIYEGFTLVNAIVILAMMGSAGWLLFNGWSKKRDGLVEQQAGEARTPPVTLWQSPFPYVLVIIALAIGWFVSR